MKASPTPKERPLLMSGPLVRATLAGTKTVTRRLVNPQPKILPGWSTRGLSEPLIDGVEFAPGTPRYLIVAADWLAQHNDEIVAKFCPHGGPGNRLWIRETMRQRDGAWTYAADGAEVSLPQDDPRIGAMLSWAHHKEGDVCVSIHMPRWASRIDLEIVSVRVERLQAITEEDAKREGVEPANLGMLADEPGCALSYVVPFRELWNEINGSRKGGATWESNPWIWRIEYVRRRPV